jgi:epoxyqueuosine reductase
MIKDNLSKFGARFRIISGEHIVELKDDIEQLYFDNKISKEIFDYVSKYYNFDILKSDLIKIYIIIIAIPQKITLINFDIKGKKIDFLIPPTYIYRKNQDIIYRILLNIFNDPNKINFANLPKKLIAVRSGLARYGKNNICYVEDFGSFHRLESFFVEYPFGIDNWTEKLMMNECNDCSLCVRICPNKCISDKDFVIKAEHCLTYFNENNDDFPEWLDIKSHNSLVGCMKCQIVCPVNRDFIKKKDRGISFTDLESEVIMKGLKEYEFPLEVLEKLRMIDLDEYLSVLPRNISVLI